MTARDLLMLKFDCETPETLRSAIEALDDIWPNPMPERHAKGFADLRDELVQELQLLEGQGNLF